MITQLSKPYLYGYSRPSFEFCWLGIFPWIKLSWHSCYIWDKLGLLNWFWRFFCEGLSLIRKDSTTHTHGLAVYVKEGLPFARDLSLENSEDSYLCFRCTFFDSILSNINEVLSIKPSADVFVFRDLTSIIRAG